MTTKILSAPPALRRWNTLETLVAARIALIASDALLLVAVVIGTSVHRSAMKTVGLDTAPSIIAAQHIKAALADMDADAVNEFLSPPAAQTTAMKAYEARRVEVAKALIGAAGNITYGDSELKPIQTLQIGLGTYERLIQKARDERASGQADFVASYREAAKEMDLTLLPAADALDDANNSHLEDTYKSQSTRSALSQTAILVFGFLALASLLTMQVFLSNRMHRTLNPLLLAASALTLVLAGYSLLTLSHETHELKVAKEDAFTSIHALWQARAVAYEANADESRYLLDPANAAAYQRDFFAKTALLARPPAAMTFEQVVADVAYHAPLAGFKGFLADELNNITFHGERDAAVATLQRFASYLTIDTQMRALEQRGQRQEALALCLGREIGQSDWAFDQFDQALDQTLAVNQSAFDSSVKAGLSALSGLEIQASVVAVLIAATIFLGLAHRIKEFD